MKIDLVYFNFSPTGQRIFGRTIKTLEAVGIEHGPIPGLIIRWLDKEYTLDLKKNILVKILGGRITKRFPWCSPNVQQAEEAWKTFTSSCPKKVKHGTA